MYVKSPRRPYRSSSVAVTSRHPMLWIKQQRKSRDISNRNRWLENEQRANVDAVCMHDFLGGTERKNLYAEAIRLVNLAAENEVKEELENRRR